MRFYRLGLAVVLCGCLLPNLVPAAAQTTQAAPVPQPAPQQAISSVASTAAQALQPAITNDDVIKLVKAGMSDTTILLLIQKSATRFDTSPKALITLKQAGVSETVISAMLSAPQSTAPSAPGMAAGAVSALANAMSQQPSTGNSNTGMAGAPTGAAPGMPASTNAPAMANTPSAMPTTSMGGMPTAAPMGSNPTPTTSMGGMPSTAMPGNSSMAGNSTPASGMNGMSTMPAASPMGSSGMAQTPASGMNGMSTMPAASPMGSSGMAQTPTSGMGTMPAASSMGPTTTPPATGVTGAATNMATQALQNYGGNAMPSGTTSLATQGLQLLTSHAGSSSVQASGIPIANLNPVQIQAAVYVGTQQPGQTRGIMVWDEGSSAANPLIHNLESVAAQQAKIPSNVTLPAIQRAPSGFGMRILTPTEWLVQLASDNAARGTPLQPGAVTPDMIRPVLHVLGYYAAPGTVGGVSSVTLMDATHKNSLQPSATAPFFAQGVMGLVAEFPLDGLAQLREQNPEFEVVVTAANGKSKSFNIKKQQFAGLP